MIAMAEAVQERWSARAHISSTNRRVEQLGRFILRANGFDESETVVRAKTIASLVHLDKAPADARVLVLQRGDRRRPGHPIFQREARTGSWASIQVKITSTVCEKVCTILYYEGAGHILHAYQG